MSYALGIRIKALRCKKKISQEEMAEVLSTTWQRYDRIEKGQADISYVMIKKIAEHLGIEITTITSAEEKKTLVSMFQEKPEGKAAIESVAKIEEILKVFHTHEKLYFQMKD